MSFDLDVLAIDATASDEAVRAMVARCGSAQHPEGDLDDRIVTFYESLRAVYPDLPPYGDDSPWTDTPLDVGIAHVSMCLSSGEIGRTAIELVLDLAERLGLTIYDPQADAVIRAAQPIAAGTYCPLWRMSWRRTLRAAAHALAA